MLSLDTTIELYWVVQYRVEHITPVAKVTLCIPTVNKELPRELCNRNLPLMNGVAHTQWGDLAPSDHPYFGYRYQSKTIHGTTWDDIHRAVKSLKALVYDQIREIVQANSQEYALHHQLCKTQPADYEETVSLADIADF